MLHLFRLESQRTHRTTNSNQFINLLPFCSFNHQPLNIISVISYSYRPPSHSTPKLRRWLPRSVLLLPTRFPSAPTSVRASSSSASLSKYHRHSFDRSSSTFQHVGEAIGQEKSLSHYQRLPESYPTVSWKNWTNRRYEHQVDAKVGQRRCWLHTLLRRMLRHEVHRPAGVQSWQQRNHEQPKRMTDAAELREEGKCLGIRHGIAGTQYY